MNAIRVYEGMAFARAVADRIVGISERAISARGRFTIALSGGKTPQAVYDILASPDYNGQIDWARTYIFWSDERCVHPSERTSNYWMAKETLINYVPIPTTNVYRIHGELPPKEAAAHYQTTLHQFFGDRLGINRPRFDLLLLGMGADGHTASLFPYTLALAEQKKWVIESIAPVEPRNRITLTYPAINAAAQIFILVTGAEKAEMLRHIFRDSPDPRTMPVAGIQPVQGDLLWLVDSHASSGIEEASVALQIDPDAVAKNADAFIRATREIAPLINAPSDEQ